VFTPTPFGGTKTTDEFGSQRTANPGILATKALVLWQMQKYQDGLDAANRAVAANSSYAYAWNIRGLLNKQLGSKNEALADFDKAARADPKWGRPLANKAEVLLALGRADEAATAYQQAQALDPAIKAPQSSRQTYNVIGINDGDTLNVRSNPGSQSPLAATLDGRATGIVITGESFRVGSDVWVPIRVGNVSGWVNRKYLSPDR